MTMTHFPGARFRFLSAGTLAQRGSPGAQIVRPPCARSVGREFLSRKTLVCGSRVLGECRSYSSEHPVNSWSIPSRRARHSNEGRPRTRRGSHFNVTISITSGRAIGERPTHFARATRFPVATRKRKRRLTLAALTLKHLFRRPAPLLLFGDRSCSVKVSRACPRCLTAIPSVHSCNSLDAILRASQSRLV